MYIETQDTQRRMGFTALLMTLHTGHHPLNLWGLEVGSRQAGQWATVWWLKCANKLNTQEIAHLLSVHRRDVSRMLVCLDLLAERQPEVAAWMDAVTDTSRVEGEE